MAMLPVGRPLIRRLAGISLPGFTPQCFAENILKYFRAYRTDREEGGSPIRVQRSRFSATVSKLSRRWSPDEEEKLSSLQLDGVHADIVAKQLGRSPESVRKRLAVLGQHRPGLRRHLKARGPRFTEQEEQLLLDMKTAGSKWSTITEKFPERSLASLKRKLCKIRDDREAGHTRSYAMGRPNCGRRWTPEEDEELCRLRDVLKLSRTETASRISRSVEAIDTRYTVLGYGAIPAKQSWTPQEDAKVLSKCKGVPWKAITAQLPNRSARQAAARYYYLKSMPRRSAGNRSNLWLPEEDAVMQRMLAAGASLEATCAALPARTALACATRLAYFRLQARLKNTRASVYSEPP